MNGFANAILTLLLSWMRVLVNDLWRLLSSEDAGLFYRFLAANWKVIVLILCAGGFVIDRIVYLIRWRPYYVWSSRLGRLKRARAARHGDVYPEEDAIPADEAPSYPPDGQEVPFPDDPASHAPGAFDQAYPQDFGATRAYAPAQDFAPGSQAPAMNQATVQYAPLEQGPLYAPYSQPYQPPQDLDPVFDETEERWEEGDALVRPLWDNPAEGMDSSFGAPRPEPIQSIRDMQAGFAPPRPPEELYAPPPAPPAPPPAAESQPVHPGLDAAEFRERLGLTQPTPLSAQKKLIGIARGKGISAVDLAGRQAVTEHFRHIFFRHFHADDSAAIQTVVCPKFKVMAVAALMMHPGGAIAFCLSLGVIGAVITLKVFGTSPKFHR